MEKSSSTWLNRMACVGVRCRCTWGVLDPDVVHEIGVVSLQVVDDAVQGESSKDLGDEIGEELDGLVAPMLELLAHGRAGDGGLRRADTG